jgi:hypothetical protein
MTRAGVKLQTVKRFEFLNSVERRLIERTLAVKGMKHNSIQQISERHVVILGERFEYLQQPLLDTDAGLDSLDREDLIVHVYQDTMVPSYRKRAFPGSSCYDRTQVLSTWNLLAREQIQALRMTTEEKGLTTEENGQ